MDPREEILIENSNEYYEFAKEALEKKRFNSATTLFFKAICATVDLFLLQSENFIPSSHTNRFRFIKEKYPKIYDILDKNFPFYQDSYTKKMNKEIAEVLKEDVETIRKMCKIWKKE